MNSQAAVTEKLELHFTHWECGHHQQMPDLIHVQSVEQAMGILRAISHAITQPGSARAAVVNEERGIDVYITDDYIGVCRYSANDVVPPEQDWPHRPVVVCGDAETIAKLHAPEIVDVQWMLGPDLIEWDGKKPLECGEWVTVAQTREQIEALFLEGRYAWPQRQFFDIPPIFKAASEVLALLEAEVVENDEPESDTCSSCSGTGIDGIDRGECLMPRCSSCSGRGSVPA